MSGNQYLFLFTIGPVQSFIAQARKTRDLYAGSAILGEIIEAAIDTAGKENVIIPNPDLKAKPNRFLAKITCENPRKFAEKVEESARAGWIAIALQSLKNVGVCQAPETSGFNEEEMQLLDYRKLEEVTPAETKDQIEDFLEVYWVMLEYDDTADYHKRYGEIQKMLAAVKNTRCFKQINEVAARKCSLDGARNALFYRKRADSAIPSYIQRNACEITTEKHLLNPGEGLSAVSLVKRFYGHMNVFPSTAAIALLYALEQLKSNKSDQEILDVFKKTFSKKSFDEQLYYEENLTNNYFLKHGYESSCLDRAKMRHEQVRSSFYANNLKFLKYYAVIAFDGDDMGKVWSGDMLSDISGLEQFQAEASKRIQEFQQQLAYRLGIFAAYAKAYLNGNIPESEEKIKEDDIWKEVQRDQAYQRLIGRREDETEEAYESRLERYTYQKGKTVYAGGDDFLGFVNLYYLFEVMSELRLAYKVLVYEPLHSNDNFRLVKPLTFSAGVVIAHYKEPLGEVLHHVRQAERMAKGIDDQKDAFSLVVMKSSGQNVSVRYKWFQPDTGDIIIEKMNTVLAGLLNNESGYSNTFINTIDRLFRNPGVSEELCYPEELVGVELRRLIARSSKNKEPEEATTGFESFYRDIDCLFKNAVTMEDFFSCLHVCDFLKKELSDEQGN